MNLLEKHLEDPTRFTRVRRGFYAVLAVVVLAEIVLPHIFDAGDHHFWFESLPAWGALFGFGSTVAIIVLSKLIGKLWLMRREDYYDR